MPPSRWLLLALAASGCVGGAATMKPEAEPFAPAATRSISGIEEYLEASGVEIAYAETKRDLENPGVEWFGYLDFVTRGACAVLQYENVEVAGRLAPRSGGGDQYLRVTTTASGNRFVSVRDRYKPTYRFGKMAVVCRDEPVEAAEALRALQAAAPPPD